MFLHRLVEFGGFELVHHWRGIDMLTVLECCLLAALLCATVALLARFCGRRRRATAAIVASLTLATAAYAANTALSALGASGAIAGANLIYVVQTAGVGGVKATFTQVATFINSLFSGDFTVASGGAATVTKTNGVAFAASATTDTTVATNIATGTLPAGRLPALTGDVTTPAGSVATTLATVNANIGSFGSATACTAFTTNAKGLITAASAVTCTPAVGSVTGLGTGVAAALTSNLSAAGGVTSTIASGTSALGIGAIASAACATVVTTAATNTATTDVVTASFNGDPTAVTGYIPATTGMLTIIAYPTANNVNFKVCNNTAASITPGAVTLNWRVAR